MTQLIYIPWDFDPELFSIGPLSLRWYGILFALGFLISQQVLYAIFKKEGKPVQDVDTLTLYMVIATIVGARLGHVFFYEPQRYLEDPMKIFRIMEGGLASHGAAVAIIIALWIYSRKKRPGQNFIQILDRIVIVVAITGACIRLGNFFNSEIIGTPTHSKAGVFFAHDVTQSFQYAEDNVFTEPFTDTRKGMLTDIEYVTVDSALTKDGYAPLKILLHYEGIGENHNLITQHIQNSKLQLENWVEQGLVDKQINTDFFRLSYAPVDPQNPDQYDAVIETHAIPRHPSQLYESASCVLLFFFLLWVWSKYKVHLPEGRLFGIFLIICFGLRFTYEFIKVDQVAFESSMTLNMGQLLSIPLFLTGIVILIRSYKMPGAPGKSAD